MRLQLESNGFRDWSILIHASARDATAKSHKIDSDFTVLFRKFMQKLGIAIFTISIFFRKVRTISFIFAVQISRDFLRCFRFAPTFSYIVCQNSKLFDFSVELFHILTCYLMRVSDISSHAIFFEYAPMGKQQYNIINFLYIGYILIYAPIQGAVDRNLMITAILIHASARDATQI